MDEMIQSFQGVEILAADKLETFILGRVRRSILKLNPIPDLDW